MRTLPTLAASFSTYPTPILIEYIYFGLKKNASFPAAIYFWVSGNHDLATPMLAARSAGWQILGVRTVSLWHLNQALHEDCTRYIGPVRFEIFA